jgi:hypothetical protein
MLQCIFHFDANPHLVEHPLELLADWGTHLASRDFDSLGCRKTGPDGADDQVECIREHIKELPLVPALCDLK